MTDIPIAALKDAFGAFPTGVTVVTVRHDGKVHGATVASFLGVSLSPPIVLVSLRQESRLASVVKNKEFSISVLAHDQEPLARHFAGSNSVGVAWRADDETLLNGASAYISCKPWKTQMIGDHLVVFGLVTAATSHDRSPLLYHRGETASTIFRTGEVTAHHG